MTELAQQMNLILAFATIGCQIFVIGLTALLVCARFMRKNFRILDIFGTYGIHLIFLVSLTTVATSLFYSEILGFEPCVLCWIQRIFLYPQVIIAGMALYKKDRGIVDYVIGLSGTGALVAIYQHYLQMGGTSFLPCPAVSTGADCAQRFLFEFGYITFPLMSFTIFAFLIIVMLFVRRAP